MAAQRYSYAQEAGAFLSLVSWKVWFLTLPILGAGLILAVQQFLPIGLLDRLYTQQRSYHQWLSQAVGKIVSKIDKLDREIKDFLNVINSSISDLPGTVKDHRDRIEKLETSKKGPHTGESLRESAATGQERLNSIVTDAALEKFASNVAEKLHVPLRDHLATFHTQQQQAFETSANAKSSPVLEEALSRDAALGRLIGHITGGALIPGHVNKSGIPETQFSFDDRLVDQQTLDMQPALVAFLEKAARPLHIEYRQRVAELNTIRSQHNAYRDEAGATQSKVADFEKEVARLTEQNKNTSNKLDIANTYVRQLESEATKLTRERDEATKERHEVSKKLVSERASHA